MRLLEMVGCRSAASGSVTFQMRASEYHPRFQRVQDLIIVPQRIVFVFANYRSIVYGYHEVIHHIVS